MPIDADMKTLIPAYSAHQRVLGFSPRTVRRRQWSLGRWGAYLDEHGATVDTATVELLEQFLAGWAAPSSRYSIRSDIHTLYTWARRRGLVAGADPTDDLPAVKVPRRAATPITPADVRRLIDGAASELDRLIVCLAAYAGLRVSEIAALRGEDVDLVGRCLVVRAGKGGLDGVVPLADELATVLARWPRRGRLVPINGQSVGDHIRRLLRVHGVAGRAHDLRHSFATQAARRTGGNLVLVAQLMRHADVATTRRYVQWHTTGHEVVTGLYDAA
jgi:integrase/recombinase XerD